MSARETRSARLIWLLVGFVIWSSALIALYGLHGVGCALLWPAGLVRALLWAVLALHLVALGGAGWRFHRARPFATVEGGFVAEISIWALYSAIAATLLGLAPPLFLTLCL